MNLKEMTASAMKWTGGLLKATLSGHVITYLGIDRHLILIIYLFALIWGSMWLGMSAAKTMVKVEDKKRELEEIRIEHAQKTVKLVSLRRISTIEELLREKGSEVTMPEKPATRIKK